MNGKFKLIWTNTDLSKEFADEKISYDLSQYDFILIQVAYARTYHGYAPETQYSLIQVGSSGKIIAVDDNVAYHVSRIVTVSNTEIVFSKANSFGYNLKGGSNSTGHAIPIKIYAIKE